MFDCRSNNQRLLDSYTNINSLTSFGKKTLETFDPFHFDFNTQIDSIINQIIRKTADEIEKPQIIITGMASDNGRWEWIQHEVVLGSFQRIHLEVDLLLAFEIPANNYRTAFYNEEDMDMKEMALIVKKLGSLNLAIHNAVLYISRDILILALNYGRTVTTYDASVLNAIVMQTDFMKSLSNQIKETEDAFVYTVHALARASEANDEDTGNHVLRVGEYCAVIATDMGMDKEFVNAIRRQATLHDVGKISTHPDILKKPGALTPEEWEEVKKHTINGTKIIGNNVRLRLGRNIALTHHERWDGTGYPNGLKGEEIPIEGRILNIADQYDALRNARVYKPAFDHEKTCKIITEGDGRTMPSNFDPKVLQSFKNVHLTFKKIYEENR